MMCTSTCSGMWQFAFMCDSWSKYFRCDSLINSWIVCSVPTTHTQRQHKNVANSGKPFFGRNNSEFVDNLWFSAKSKVSDNRIDNNSHILIMREKNSCCCFEALNMCHHPPPPPLPTPHSAVGMDVDTDIRWVKRVGRTFKCKIVDSMNSWHFTRNTNRYGNEMKRTAERAEYLHVCEGLGNSEIFVWNDDSTESVCATDCESRTSSSFISKIMCSKLFAHCHR